MDNLDPFRPTAGTDEGQDTNAPDPFPITERMFRAMIEYGRSLPNEVNSDDEDL